MKIGSGLKRKLKRLLTLSLILGLLVLLFLLGANYYVISKSKKSIYSDVNAIPYNKTALVLGTAKYLSKGVDNPFYKNRMEAAVELYKARKVKYLILSGDNSTMDYNEPITMKNDLVAAGIPDSVLFLDYAGFRTLDAVIRAKEIFGQTSLTIVSQPFHNYRAVYLCRQNDIKAVAYNAKEVSYKIGFRTFQREWLARVKAVMDIMLNKQPKFLGEKIIIPD